MTILIQSLGFEFSLSIKDTENFFLGLWSGQGKTIRSVEYSIFACKKFIKKVR